MQPWFQWRRSQWTCQFFSTVREFRTELLQSCWGWVASRSQGTSVKYRWHNAAQHQTVKRRKFARRREAVCRQYTGGDERDVLQRRGRLKKCTSRTVTRTLPWGTPDRHVTGDDRDVPTPMYWVLPIKNKCNESNATPSRPKSSLRRSNDVLKSWWHDDMMYWSRRCRTQLKYLARAIQLFAGFPCCWWGHYGLKAVPFLLNDQLYRQIGTHWNYRTSSRSWR